jgi:hypothetical protein
LSRALRRECASSGVLYLEERQREEEEEEEEEGLLRAQVLE